MYVLMTKCGQQSKRWTVRSFSKILYAFKFPEVLSFNTDTTATGDAILQDNVRRYFQTDPLGQYALRTLVNAAVEETKKVGMKSSL